MKNLKIGITIGVKSATESIWTNGIKLNVLMFARMLKQSTNNYQVCLLNSLEGDLSKEKPYYFRDIDIYPFAEKYEEMDLIILMGAQAENKYLNHFKSLPGKKLVSYRCGNEYVLLMESILFKSNTMRAQAYEAGIDEIWYIPQQHETNAGFFRTFNRTNALVVPFVWDKQYILNGLVEIHTGHKEGRFTHDYAYRPKDQKVLGVAEPNLNVVKFCLIPMLIAEECYRGQVGKERIKKLMLTNAEKLGKDPEFMDVVKTLDLFADGKITAESRYQTAYLLSQFVDVLICHQVLNPLNYIYLDAAYMEYPVLHNARMVKDLGYYYEGSDTRAAAKQLDYILTEHDKNLPEYRARNQMALRRYEANNPEIIATYDRLLANLFEGGNPELSYEETTNGYREWS